MFTRLLGPAQRTEGQTDRRSRTSFVAQGCQAAQSSLRDVYIRTVIIAFFVGALSSEYLFRRLGVGSLLVVVLSIAILCARYNIITAFNSHRVIACCGRRPSFESVYTVFPIAVLAGAATAVIAKNGVSCPHRFASSTAVTQMSSLLMTQLFTRKTLSSMISMKWFGRSRVVIIGEPFELCKLSSTILYRYFGMKEVGRIAVTAEGEISSDSVLNSVDHAIRKAQQERANQFVVALRWESKTLLATIIAALRNSPLPVRLLPDTTIRSLLGPRRLLTYAPTVGVELQRGPISRFRSLLKRILDITLASLAIVTLSPLLAIVALAIKLDSPGPVIFRQRRIGFNGLEFVIWKFRTMTVLEDGPIVKQAQQKDDRVTRVGRALRKSSIDELPQFFNVLKGEMSVVGPRPHAVAHDVKYNNLIPKYVMRQHVKPGLTGWAQVNGLRGETERLEQMAERVRFDLWYVRHWSLALDIKIVLKTCFEVLRCAGY